MNLLKTRYMVVVSTSDITVEGWGSCCPFACEIIQVMSERHPRSHVDKSNMPYAETFVMYEYYPKEE